MSAQDSKFNPPVSKMTLLDHFAGLTMQSLLSNDIMIGAKEVDIARLAYQQADSMLAVRDSSIKIAVEKDTGSTDGWISVNDRLPKDNQECLVFLKDLIPEVMNKDTSRVTSDTFRKGRWGLDYHNQYVVTHWKQMPEPPNDAQPE